MVVSWDCFDTLVSRYYHYPKSIFELISHNTNHSDFVQKRLHAEKIATNKTLQGIYEHLPGHDSRLELELEKKYSYPIKENFHRIKDGDIIVSDMYLSSEEILDILRYHGLDKDVKVYSTYGKKANGSIWNELREKYDIKFHIGDNIHSDVIIQRNYGINTIYYGSSYLTNAEKIIERYSPYLAYWIKYIRLSQPYFIPYKEIIFDKGSLSRCYGIYWILEKNGEISLLNQVDENNEKIILEDTFSEIAYYLYKNQNSITVLDEYNKKDISAQWIDQPVNTSRFDEYILWTEQASYNIPLLINSSYLLPKNIVFSYRDCYFWKQIYDSIFDTNVPVLESCRNSYLYPYSDEYKEYVLSITNNKTIVDLHGTGYSSGHFFKQQGVEQKILFVSEHADNNIKNINIKNLIMCFDRIFPETLENTRFNHNTLASKHGLKCCCGTTLEKFNIPPDLGPMVGWGGEAIRKKSEHNQTICKIFDNCIKSAIQGCIWYRDRINGEEDLTQILMKLMNKVTYTDSVVHSLWEKRKNIRII
jgi:FMN phosphatase YigB (HAD superfamily)